MSKHKPVSRLRWQASQKLILQRWKKKDLNQQKEKAEQELLPVLQRYAKHYPDDASVLEIGCGPFCRGQHLPQKNKTYLDPLIDDYRRMYPGKLPEEGEFITSTAERINKPANSYDLVLCLNMISHSLNPELVMHEIERLLKPDGKLILAMRTHSSLEARLHYWAIRSFPFLCNRTRPYYYSLTGIRRTLKRHFSIQHEIARNTSAVWMPFFKREQRIFICTRMDGEDAKS